VIINDGSLNIPRDEISKNAFVLWPLAEVAADVLHPQFKQTIAAMWQAFDKDSQSLWPVEFDWG